MPQPALTAAEPGAPLPDPDRPRLAVVGDVRGHFDTFAAALTGLGVDVGAARVPDDLTVVQVGGLVGAGPRSDAVVELVDRLLTGNGGRWVQLVGVPEARCLSATRPRAVSGVDAWTVRRWWDAGSMVAAAAFTVTDPSAPAGGLLVSHAGLTHGCWTALDRPGSAADAAAAVNAARFDRSGPVWRFGHRTHGRIALDAGPVWAEPSEELYSPWVQSRLVDDVGFGQVHGHESAFRWDACRWRDRHSASRFAASATVDPDRRHVRVVAGRQVLWGVDPGHGAGPAPRWSPLVFTV